MKARVEFRNEKGELENMGWCSEIETKIDPLAIRNSWTRPADESDSFVYSSYCVVLRDYCGDPWFGPQYRPQQQTEQTHLAAGQISIEL